MECHNLTTIQKQTTLDRISYKKKKGNKHETI